MWLPQIHIRTYEHIYASPHQQTLWLSCTFRDALCLNVGMQAPKQLMHACTRSLSLRCYRGLLRWDKTHVCCKSMAVRYHQQLLKWHVCECLLVLVSWMLVFVPVLIWKCKMLLFLAAGTLALCLLVPFYFLIEKTAAEVKQARPCADAMQWKRQEHNASRVLNAETIFFWAALSFFSLA